MGLEKTEHVMHWHLMHVFKSPWRASARIEGLAVPTKADIHGSTLLASRIMSLLMSHGHRFQHTDRVHVEYLAGYISASAGNSDDHRDGRRF